jgi:hypothetical protein
VDSIAFYRMTTAPLGALYHGHSPRRPSFARTPLIPPGLSDRSPTSTVEGLGGSGQPTTASRGADNQGLDLAWTEYDFDVGDLTAETNRVASCRKFNRFPDTPTRDFGAAFIEHRV